MKQRLVALPVSGDAFFFQRNGRAILVDSGGSGRLLGNLLDKYVPTVTRIDVAVCTHADSDHAGGFTSLLDHWRPQGISPHNLIGEFWLPGAWVPVIRHLLIEANKLANALIEELEKVRSKSLDIPQKEDDIDLIADKLDQQIWPASQENKHIHLDDIERERIDDIYQTELYDLREPEWREPEWMKELRTNAKQILGHRLRSARALESARRRVRYRRKRGYIGSTLAKYWLSLIDTADRIRKIATCAIEHNIRIRWFDFSEFQNTGEAKGGNRGFLVPINAVEQTPAKPSDAIHLLSFCLSVLNRQCLSFYVPQLKYLPGVLFCGDSPMGSGSKCSSPFPFFSCRTYWPIFVTAPHHGADSCEIAYQHINKWAGPENVIWLRSGGLKRHPENAYRNLPTNRRFCTYCPHKKLNPTPIDMDFVEGRWPFFLVLASGHRCYC